jgi:uncharacterized protein YbcI
VNHSQQASYDTQTDGGAAGELNNRDRPLSKLSNEIVRIYKEQFGRGPTKVRTHWAGSDTLVCLLENTFTLAEKNLQAMGEHQRLRDMRMFFQYATSAEFIETVERSTGRRVRSFISGIDTNADVACELFVLEPPDESPERLLG